jgi:3-hydroxymyristoyl/3-hydroxydecanoyl-(acyl carrier protein) dehydratase
MATIDAPLDARFTIAPDHPCLAGHFPDRPVVPAVVLLDEVLAAVRQGLAGIGRLRAVSSAKFMRPVLPGQEVTVSLQPQDAGATIEFRCHTTEGLVAQGRLRMDPS